MDKQTEQKNTHGGCRPGAGRPSMGNTIPLGIRVSPENREWLKKQKSASLYINQLLDREREKSTI